MRKTIISLGIFTLMLTTGLTLQTGEVCAAPEVINLKWADMFPPVMDEAVIGDVFGDMVAKATDGRVKITYYHAEALGKEKDILENLEKGVCDICETASGVHPAEFAGLSAGISLPLPGISSRTILNSIAWELYYKGYFKWDKAYSEFKVLGFQTMPPAIPFIGKKKVRTADDFKGLKIRSPDRNLDKLLKGIGAVPVAIPGPEVYMAMDRGMIDGLITTYTYVLGAKFYEVAKYCIMKPFQINSASIFMSKKVWNGLPTDIKAIIDSIIPEYQYEYLRFYQDKDSSALEALNKKGLEVHDLDPGEWKPFEELASKIKSEWIAEKEAAGMPAREMMELIDKILKRYQQ